MSDSIYNVSTFSAAASIIDTNGGNDTLNTSGSGLVNKTVDLGAGGWDRIVNTSASFALTLDSIGATGDIRGVEEIVGTGTGTQAGRTIAGTSGSDRLDFTGITLTNVRIIQANAGHDTVTGSAGNDWIEGGTGNDVINGGAGNDTLGGGGATLLDTVLQAGGGTATNTLEGGAGDDVFVAGSGGDVMSDTGGGRDMIVATFDSLLNDVVTGGIETIANGNASFWLTLDSFGGANGHIRGVTEIIGAGTGAGRQIQGTCNADDSLDFCGVTLTNITSVDLKSGNDYVRTAASHSLMTVYNGNAGTDTIRFGITHDQAARLSDAEVDALLDYLAGPAGRTLTLASVNITATGFEKAEIGMCGMNVVTGTPGGDVIRPTPGPDLILPDGGDDTVGMNSQIYKPDSSADIMFLGDGDDVVIGTFMNFTNSVIRGGDGWDVIKNWTGNQPLVFKSVGAGGFVSGIEEIVGTTDTSQSVSTGNDMGRVISGTAGADLLDFTGIKLTDIRLIAGVGGNDTIIGSAAGDSIEGGDGADSINGGGGNDTLTGSVAVSTDTSVNMLEGGAGDDVFIAGSGADVISDTGGGADEIRATGSVLVNDLVTGGIEKVVNTSASFGLTLDSFGAGRDIQGVTEIVGNGTGIQGGRTIQGTTGADILDFTGVTLTNIATVSTLGGNDVMTVASAHGVATRYEGGLPSTLTPGYVPPGDTIRINDALYDAGGTSAGVTTVFLQDTTTVAFTYTGFETVQWFI